MGMWLPLADAQALADAQQRLPRTQKEYEAILRAPLYSLDMTHTYTSIAELKQYLMERWRAMRAVPSSAPTQP